MGVNRVKKRRKRYLIANVVRVFLRIEFQILIRTDQIREIRVGVTGEGFRLKGTLQWS